MLWLINEIEKKYGYYAVEIPAFVAVLALLVLALSGK